MKTLRCVFCIAVVLFILCCYVLTASIISELLEQRPDFYLLPFRYAEIKTQENKLKQEIIGICRKVHEFHNEKECAKQKPIIFSFSFIRLIRNVAFNESLPLAYVLNFDSSKAIFLDKILIDNFAEDEIQFVLAHELGHKLKNTANEFVVDRFAALTVGAEAGIGFYKRIQKVQNIKFNSYLNLKIRKLQELQKERLK